MILLGLVLGAGGPSYLVARRMLGLGFVLLGLGPAPRSGLATVAATSHGAHPPATVTE